MDCSPSGPSVYGIFQARVLEWVAIAFSEYHIYDTVIIVTIRPISVVHIYFNVIHMTKS